MSKRTRLPGQSNTPPSDTPDGMRNALGPFGMVPAGVIESSLSDAAVRLYAYLWRRTQNANGRRPAYATIADDLGWSRAKARRAVDELQDALLLTVEHRYNADGSQQTNDYVLEWSSPAIPAQTFTRRSAPESPREVAPVVSSPAEAPQEVPPAVSSPTTTGGVLTGEHPPVLTSDSPGCSPVTPKEEVFSSLSLTGGARANGPVDDPASPVATVEAAWVEAYNANHATPAMPHIQRKAREVAEELLGNAVAVQVAAAAARAAGAAGIPWIDRYVAQLTRTLPTPAAAGPGRGERRTYGAGLVSTPTPTALRPGEQCRTHPGQSATNCGGCRADALADESQPTRQLVDRRDSRR